MPCVSDLEDGPKILQLKKWGSSGLPFKISEFSDASLSPSRKILLLLSYQFEALLLPIVADKISSLTNKNDVEECYLGVEEPSSLPLNSGRTAVCQLGSEKDILSCSESESTESNTVSASGSLSVIPDVKSFTWGHFRDVYTGVQSYPFRELLIVTDHVSITVHAFCDPREIPQNASTAEYGYSHGNWQEWCPNFTQNTTELCRSHFHSGETSFNKAEVGGGYVNSRCNSFMPQRWLKTFHTELNTVTSDKKFAARFPTRSSLPHSVDVVSFSIYNSTHAFLDFFRKCGQGVSQCHTTTEDPSGCISGGDLPDSINYHEGKVGFKAEQSDRFYRCSKVFSSTSNCYIGFVLTCPLNQSIGAIEYHLPGSTLVVVITLYWWGMQWMCAVDLQTVYSRAGICPDWADFQFSSDFLLCLNTSGLICVLEPTNGSLVTCIDVLRSCGLNSIIEPSLDQIKSVTYGGSTILKDKLGSKVNQTDNVSRDDTVPESQRCARRFKRLVVSSSSPFAAIDDYGIIYVTHADDCTLKMHVSDHELRSQSLCYDCDMLMPWKIAGAEIDGQQVFNRVHQSNVFWSNDVCYASSSENHTTPSKSREKCISVQGNTYLSGFSSISLVGKEKLPDENCRMSSNIMRRVLLPFERFEKVDSICLSSFGISKLVKCAGKDGGSYRVDHIPLNVGSLVLDDRGLQPSFPYVKPSLPVRQATYVKESIGFSFQGCLYLVTQDGLSIVLPSTHVSQQFLPKESSIYWIPNTTSRRKHQIEDFLDIDICRRFSSNWKFEVLDRVLLYECPEVADSICRQNNWDTKFTRLRRMQLALHYMKSDEIEKSLDMLSNVNMAEEGVLGLLFTSLYHICSKRSDYEVAYAMRLLSLAACFASKMLRRYSSMLYRKSLNYSTVKNDHRTSYIHPRSLEYKFIEVNNSRKASEMACFLEAIRDMQGRLTVKSKRTDQDPVSIGKDALMTADMDVLQEDSSFPVITLDSSLSNRIINLETQTGGLEFSTYGNAGELPLSPVVSGHMMNEQEVYIPDKNFLQKRKLLPPENPRDMIARWVSDHLDLKTVVKDAINFGRLPLAVLQLHIQRKQELFAKKDSHDIFMEVRDIGRSIAYELFLKGESGLAVATLEKLGEDVEFLLRQLLFGTVRKALRSHIGEEMKAYGFLRSHECTLLERISLIERLYPSCGFWVTFHQRSKKIKEANTSIVSVEAENVNVSLDMYNNLIIECGDIDGVVSESWASVDNGSDFSDDCEDNARAGYWACAAAWSDSWNNTTMDRIVLDQPLQCGVHIQWESQLEYHMSHNNLDEVIKLLDKIPSSLLLEGTLKINLDSPHFHQKVGNEMELMEHGMHIYGDEELEHLYMEIPNIKIFSFSCDIVCSSWLKMYMEQELAKQYIFLQEYWESAAELITLFGRAGLIMDTSGIIVHSISSMGSQNLDVMKVGEKFDSETLEAVHKLVIIYCTQYNLPSLMDIYLDHQNLPLNDTSLSELLKAAGSCQWAQWLLFSRIKGREYEASFANSRSNLPSHMALGRRFSAIEIDEIVRTVDDMAEGGGEFAALATMIHASVPLQKCIYSGSVKRHSNSSSQCTLENLRPALQQFPTLWKMLFVSCFGQDFSICPSFSSPLNVLGKSAFSDYLQWRDSMFSATGGDTSLIQILPCWFPKSVRRLAKIFVQGPLAWQTLSDGISMGELSTLRSNYSFDASAGAMASSISREAAIQKNVEELYSSSEKSDFGVEHHLHRCRALAAFNHLLGVRATKLKVIKDVSGQANVQSDVQRILSPLTPDEGSLISSVLPLAIVHFEDDALVASCAFLLELCGLSANLLRVDVASLHRISSYYKMVLHSPRHGHASPKASPFHPVLHDADLAVSLARSLADGYMHLDHLSFLEHKNITSKNSSRKQTSRSLMIVLQHLEKASLPVLDEGKTCGFWLSSGVGDGYEFRHQQKAASEHWKLVTTFCQMHDLPLSTKYLSLLAKDNDWVGFLTDAQSGGFSIDVIIQVAAKEFSDPRLRTHVLTVLRTMQSMKNNTNSSTCTTSEKGYGIYFSDEHNTFIPDELFGLLADCERQKNPGEALLLKAKNLRWSLLAVIASCFSDVSSLSCLTVWLEITAARETSSIKVNDIYSKIARGVGIAVKSTNALPIGSRSFTFRYNRKSPKRRRLMELASLSSETSVSSPKASTAIASFVQEISNEEEKKKTCLENNELFNDPDDGLVSLSNMVAVLCEQHLFLPLLRAFEMFLPSCSLLPFLRSLQAFSQMRLSEASQHLVSFSARIKEEPSLQLIVGKDTTQLKTAWICSMATKAAEAVLSACPSAYEKRCLLQLLAAADFGDGNSTATYFGRLYWKINLAEPSLRRDDELRLGNETLDDASLLEALEKNGHWEQAHNWARQLESSGPSWQSTIHHVTEAQAEAMVSEWKEFLWDVPEERTALWNHVHALFIRYSFPALQAGLFFLKHADSIEKEIPAKEIHDILLLALQWLSGTMTHSNPVYPVHLLREIETRIWLLAVESEDRSKGEGHFVLPSSVQSKSGDSASIIDQTATVIEKMDNHINAMRTKVSDSNNAVFASNTRTKRRSRIYQPTRRTFLEFTDISNDSDDYSNSTYNLGNDAEASKKLPTQFEDIKIESSISGWEEKVGPADLERAVLSLLEFGQISAAKQLQYKLSPTLQPSELILVDAALKLASLSSYSGGGKISKFLLDSEVLSVFRSYDIFSSNDMVDAMQALESLATKCGQGSGHGICQRIIAVNRAAKLLGLTFSDAYEKRPIELLQLLSLKAQDSFEEAKILVQTHTMTSSSTARVLAESFLKGLLAAHRGGYMDWQKEEGPAPLMWRTSDFLKWAELCSSEQEIGHALMRLVMTGQDIPHSCEVELLILAHHFYKSSACLDGVDVLVTLAANRVEFYVSEGDFSSLARLVTGVSNFRALNFILNILIENGQLELLLQSYSSTETGTSSTEAARGFRMAVLTSLRLFSPNDYDAFTMVYNHFNMKHETAALLEFRSEQHVQQWLRSPDRDWMAQDLLDAMRFLIEAAEVHSTIDAGHKTKNACSQALLLSFQIRIPDIQWTGLSDTNARRLLVEQSRFLEALVVAEAYDLNHPTEWAQVVLNHILRPEIVEEFVEEFVSALPLQPSMLLEVARIYRSEVTAREDQRRFGWLQPERPKHMLKSFRCLLKRTRDVKLRMQLAAMATGFADVVDDCMKRMDKLDKPVLDNPAVLVLRKGHGGAYLPLM